ncbi:hypothetical protein WMO40_22355 [Bacillaceae bacterium CLA-AA-H227]|uniref:Uncharacterized protein n=1 Tax=Robertmurraya yapensis (ex Hitch et al 2024) TaxID=3133160 RepID=A0ACC6SHX4_9BACI
MVRVNSFRNFTLYQRSLDLTRVVYEVSHIYKESLSNGNIGLIRKYAGHIPNQIASALIQVNMNVRFRKLNEAVATLKKLRVLMNNLEMRKEIDYKSWCLFEQYRIEVIKLLNGYFGWLGSFVN